MDWESHWPLRERRRELRDELLAAYASAERGYHDERHLAEVLSRLEELAEHVAFDRRPVLLAAWFHDGVYDGRPGAEERSAAWAETTLPSAGCARGTVAEVGRLVRMTADHRPDGGRRQRRRPVGRRPGDPRRLASALCGVRRRCPSRVRPRARDALPQGRAAILRELLAKPTLFHTRVRPATWEDQPAQNGVRISTCAERHGCSTHRHLVNSVRSACLPTRPGWRGRRGGRRGSGGRDRSEHRAGGVRRGVGAAPAAILDHGRVTAVGELAAHDPRTPSNQPARISWVSARSRR